jgi:hypothetical protein
VEEAFDSKGFEGIQEYEKAWRVQLLVMVAMVRGELTKMQRMIMGALIVRLSHSIT